MLVFRNPNRLRPNSTFLELLQVLDFRAQPQIVLLLQSPGPFSERLLLITVYKRHQIQRIALLESLLRLFLFRFRQRVDTIDLRHRLDL